MQRLQPVELQNPHHLHPIELWAFAPGRSLASVSASLPVGCIRLRWVAFGCSGLQWAAAGCIGFAWELFPSWSSQGSDRMPATASPLQPRI